MFYAVEDQLSEALLLKVLKFYGVSTGWQKQLGRQSGDSDVRANIGKYEELSRKFPVFVLLDLDRRPCAVTYRLSLSTHFSRVFIFRIAVTEAESWLMADIDGFSHLVGVDKSSILARRDWEKVDAKEAFLDAVEKLGGRDLKEKLLPRHGSGASVGLEYNSTLVKFVHEEWSPDRASENSESLKRMIARVSEVDSAN